MDKLEMIFQLQKQLNEDISARRGLGRMEGAEWVQKNVLAMISELGELLNEVNFKWWKNATPIDRDAVCEEMVDVLHFFVSMCCCVGMDAQELFERYIAKNKENFDRQNGLSKKKGYDIREQASTGALDAHGE
jgi:dimeric dUTPase (all-alpha-NTP-PPase superfamily)